MIAELLVATAMVCVTVLVHGWGLSILGRILRAETNDELAEHISWSAPRAVAFTMAMVLGLFALHGVEIWAYAALYLGLGAIEDLRSAVYFSTTTYGAIGYSDAPMAERWRLIAAIEGINGVILLGWSTAFFVTVMGRAREIRWSRKSKP